MVTCKVRQASVFGQLDVQMALLRMHAGTSQHLRVVYTLSGNHHDIMQVP